jgi:hypothetical protein
MMMKWLKRMNPVNHFLDTFPKPDFNIRGYFYEAAVQKLNFQDITR